MRLELRESRALGALLLALHGAGAACVLLAWPGPAGAALAGVLVAIGAWASWGVALLRRRSSVRAIELGTEAAAVLELVDGRRVHARVGPRRNVNSWWVTLPLSGTRRTLLVVRGMLSQDEFRRLRLWALWGRVPGASRAADRMPELIDKRLVCG